MKDIEEFPAANHRPHTLAPTAVLGVTDDMKIAHQEIFGPGRRNVLDRTTSGNVAINGTIMPVAQDDLPFGGVGARRLSHAKASTSRDGGTPSNCSTPHTAS